MKMPEEQKTRKIRMSEDLGYIKTNFSGQFQALNRAKNSVFVGGSPEDRTHSYGLTIATSVATGLVHTLLGAVLLSVSLHSGYVKDSHVLIFTIAYHFFAAEGILSMSHINGWSTPIRKSHRRYAHVFLQTCTVLCAVIGMLALSVTTITASRTLHGLSGLLTLVLTAAVWVLGPFLMRWVIGPFVLRGARSFLVIHKIVGLICFFMSSICLSSGLVKHEFIKWVGKEVVTILLVFIVFYTFTIIYTSCMKYAQLSL